MSGPTFPDAPTECCFCHKTKADGTDLNAMSRVDWHGKFYTGALCSDCVRLFIMEMAHRDRVAFEKLVVEARNWKPGDP